MGFVNARNIDTGRVESVPEHYLDLPFFRFEATEDRTNCVDCVLPPEPEKAPEPEVTPATVFSKKTATRSKED